MPQFETYVSPGFGQHALDNFAYVQAARVGDIIHLAGQGGWDRESKVINKEINAQIDQAFENVDFNLKFAGGQGWSQVYKVRSYHMPLNTEAMDAMVRNFKKWMPNHKAIWTCVQVGRLGEDDMRVEIEVEAHDPEGSKKTTPKFTIS
ncbi:YjgF-like protein [Nemania abortiva]|nr:YjgF-like protein [Nemania abortiva]